MASPSSPTGASREAERLASVLRWAIFVMGSSITIESSSLVGSRPSSTVSRWMTRRIAAMRSTMWTGSRSERPWVARARLMDCLIHQAA